MSRLYSAVELGLDELAPDIDAVTAIRTALAAVRGADRVRAGGLAPPEVGEAARDLVEWLRAHPMSLTDRTGE